MTAPRPARLLRRTERAADRIQIPVRRPIGLGRLLGTTVRQAARDQLPAYAGNLAYHGLLALFPTLLAITWLLEAFQASDLVNGLMSIVATTIPRPAAEAIQSQIDAAGGPSRGTLTAGALLALAAALWTLASAVRGVMQALNRIYTVEERRPWPKRWGISFLLGGALGLLLVAALAVIMLGNAAATEIAQATGWGVLFEWSWTTLTWTALAAAVTAAFALVYYVGPDVQQRFRWVSPGAVVAVLLWLLFTAAFSVYVNRFANFDRTYGVFVGVVVLLLYLYGTALILLAGAEMNHVLEMNDPAGKNDGERDLPM